MNTDAKLNSSQCNGKKPRAGLWNALRAVAFLVLFAFCFVKVQELVVPNRDIPSNPTRFQKSMSGLLNEKQDSLDVLWIGTSHVYSGISPMEIYRDTGIRSHLISGPALRAGAAYYLLREALKHQTPKLVLVDASCLTYSKNQIPMKTWWQTCLDALPFSLLKTRIDIASKLAELNGEPFNDEYIARSIFPIFQYHTNVLLEEEDWLDTHPEQVYHKKGYRLSPQINAMDEALDMEIDDQLGAEDVEELLIDDSEQAISLNDSVIAQAVEENRIYLEQMIDLCRENGSELILIKVPVHQTDDYRGFWSLEKHTLFQMLASEYDLTFLDLNYEDTGIDWNNDTIDGGQHLNIHGATKLSRFMAQWLTEHFDIGGSSDDVLKAQWDTQLELYDWELDKYRYTDIQDPQAYFEALKDPSCTVMINVNGDVSGFWTDELQTMFTRLTGCKQDLRSPKNAAFALIACNGHILLQKSAKRSLEYRGTLEDGTAYTIKSSAYSESDTGRIRIDHQTITSSRPGLQIVVYDNQLRCAIDSVILMAEEESEEPGITLYRWNKAVYRIMSLAIADHAYKVIAAM